MDTYFSTVQGFIVTYGLKIVIALLVFFMGKWLARKITNIVLKLMRAKSVDETLCGFLENIIYYVLLVIVIITAAGQLGIETTSFIAVLGAASLAIGLALKDSLSNFSSGVMLILFRPFKVGDVISAGGETGKVESITVFNTILNTPDNQRKIVPNSAILGGSITNVNVNPTRRIDLVIGIGYDDDIKKAKETLEAIVAGQTGVLKDPAPTIAVSELGDSAVNLRYSPMGEQQDLQQNHQVQTPQL